MTPRLETEADARNFPAVRAVHALQDTGPGWREAWDSAVLAILTAPCERAGVEPGGYEESVLRWLAGYEPQMCAAVANLMERMFEAGKAARDERGEGAGPDAGQSGA